MQGIVNPADPTAVQNRKLLQIVEALMRRAEQAPDDRGAAYAQFQRSVLLEDQVKDRTRELERALDLLNESNSLLTRATAEAEAARRNLSAAIEAVQDGFALFDRNDVLVMCNSRFGMHMSDIRPALAPGLGFADYVALVSTSRNLALAAGETPESWAVARMRRHSERHVFFNVALTGDRWVQISEHRTQDGATAILQTDLTDIIRLERQERGKLLDHQARNIRATLEHISQGVGIFDAERRLVGWNRRLAELLAMPIARLRIGAPFDTLLSALSGRYRPGGGFSARDLRAWVNSAEPRAALDFELSDEAGVVLAAFAQEMPDRGFVMSFTDITAERAALRALSEVNETLEARVSDRTVELAEALDKAELANAARSRFVAAASHDLLQPLSAAKLFLASISDEALAPPARMALDKAQKALVSVEDILAALLAISKLETGQSAVLVDQVHLGQMLRQLRDEFAPVAAAKGLRLTILPCNATVLSDATYLRRILQNLIGNAIRYTRAGRVLVGGRRKGALLRLEVIDTGPGIPPEEHENVFREFHRLNARASASEGMGLGLAIVQRACALLGHPLDLQSAPGRGTRFSVTVPLTAPAGDPGAEPPGRAAPLVPPAPSGQIVMLVENDAELRRALGHLLETWQVEVIEAETAEEALELLDEIGILPDRFLIDYQLGPGANGVELIGQLQQRYGPVDARIVTAARLGEVARADPAVRVINKPIDSRELADYLFGPR